MYRDKNAKDVPIDACEVPILSGDKEPFWRKRTKNMMPVPFFFAGSPSKDDGKGPIDLDSRHKGLSRSYLISPYDGGVVLASSECLILLRARMMWEKDWVAADLKVCNIFGEPLEHSPSLLVRIDGEQLPILTAEQANALIPDNLLFGEFKSTSKGNTVSAEITVQPLGIGTAVGYGRSWGAEEGNFKQGSKVHPLRRELITKTWDSGSQLGEGAFKRGFFLFKPPSKAPDIENLSCTLAFCHSNSKEFAHLDFKGFLQESEESRSSRMCGREALISV